MQEVNSGVNKLVESFAKRLLKLTEHGLSEEQIVESLEASKALMVRSFFSQQAQSLAHKTLLVDSGKVPASVFEASKKERISIDDDVDVSDI